MIDLNALGREQMYIRQSKRCEGGEKLNKKTNMKMNMEKKCYNEKKKIEYTQILLRLKDKTSHYLYTKVNHEESQEGNEKNLATRTKFLRIITEISLL
jgi:hypothetical protein